MSPLISLIIPAISLIKLQTSLITLLTSLILINPILIITLISDFCLSLLLHKLILSNKSLIIQCWTRLSETAQLTQTFTVPKFDRNSHENPLYHKSITYLRTLTTEQPIVELFNGAKICWTKPLDGSDRLEIRVKRTDRVRVLRPYLMRVEWEADKIKQSRETRIEAKREIRRVVDKWEEEKREGEGSGRFGRSGNTLRGRLVLVELRDCLVVVN